MPKKLPNKRYHKAPRMLWSDAYTVNGFTFESPEAIDSSEYYGVYRKFPTKHENFYNEDDQRIVFAGLQALCDMLFYEPITHEEIDESIAFLKGRKVKANGEFDDFEFPEELWRRVVDECEGYIPLKIEAVPEGSVVYPHEPFLRIKATKKGFGSFVAWFESTLLHVWAATERLTAARHFLEQTYERIRTFEPDSVTDEECMLLARLTIHDFGDRAAASPMESELVARVHNYVFFGTDTFRAAYQNWKNGAPAAYGSSVKALAHRIVQAFEEEKDCYNRMYETSNENELLSMVGDCYDYWNALENYLIPLAQKAQKENSGKVIVARPDSGDSEEMVIGTLQKAKKAGLMKEYELVDGTYYISTNLRFIVGNGENFDSVNQMIESCLAKGFVPWRCGIFGIGGHLRNNINRDHLSTKFALCSVGESQRPVIKFSNSPGKQTLPACKVLRDHEALSTGVTLKKSEEAGNDSLVLYYNGEEESPFGKGFLDDFLTCENRVIKTFSKMPLHAGEKSESLKKEVETLRKKYVK